MNKFLKDTLAAHISSNRICYIIALLTVIAGIAIGIFSGINVGRNYNEEYIDTFLSAFAVTEANPFKLFTKSILLNLRTILIIWLASWFIWLIPVSFVELGAKGYGFGYSLSYLIFNCGFKGLALSSFALLLQNLILMPALIIYVVLQVNFSCELDKIKKSASLYKERKRLLIKNGFSFLFILIPTLFCGLIDSYITPFLINFLI